MGLAAHRQSRHKLSCHGGAPGGLILFTKRLRRSSIPAGFPAGREWYIRGNRGWAQNSFLARPVPSFSRKVRNWGGASKKSVPAGRIPARESSGICWTWGLEIVLPKGLLGGKVAKIAPKIAKMRENARKVRARSRESPSLVEVGARRVCPGPGGIPKGENPGVENFDLAVDSLARMIFEKKVFTKIFF